MSIAVVRTSEGRTPVTPSLMHFRDSNTGAQDPNDNAPIFIMMMQSEDASEIEYRNTNPASPYLLKTTNMGVQPLTFLSLMRPANGEPALFLVPLTGLDLTRRH